MALAQDIAALREADLFSGFSDEQLRLIAFTSTSQVYPQDSLVFEEGAPGEGAYLVVRGRLALESSRNSLGVAGPGSLLAEVALLSDIPHRFTAYAVDASDILFIRREQFRKLIEEYPDIAAEMDRRMRANFSELVSALNAVKTRLSDF